MRKLVLGDIHGRFEALKEVLLSSKFDYKKDKLICLGDIVDGGYNTAEVVEELLKIKHLVFVLGNHDEWFMNHLRSGWMDSLWTTQGGNSTIKSYGIDKGMNVPVTHQDFFNSGVFYHIEDNMLFVHGGFNPKVGVENTSKKDLLWDRNLIHLCRSGIRHKNVVCFDKIFVGHTTTQQFHNDPKVKNCLEPLTFGNLIMMDTGAGWSGKLTIMDINSEEFWQSKTQKGGR